MTRNTARGRLAGSNSGRTGATCPSRTPERPLDTRLYQQILGDELRQLRRHRGWTRRQLSERLPSTISLQTLATYELGTRQCSVVRFAELCVAMGELPQNLLAKAHGRFFLDVPGRVRVDLTKVLADLQPELLPLRRWAQDRLAHSDSSASTEIQLNVAALEGMAQLCCIPTLELVGRLRQLAGW